MWTRAIFWIVLVTGAPLMAQSWDSLRDVRGQHVKVIATSGETQKGICDSVSADGITVQAGSSRITIERNKVRRVQVRSGARRVRNFVIGAAIGLAVGVTVDQTVGTYLRNETGDSGRGITYAAPIVVFGGIGAALPGYRTVYRMR
jgi:hypothetical protein